MPGAATGFAVELCLPDNVTLERKRILQACGARLVLTDPLESSDGAIREARRRYHANPDRYYYPDQYNNPANWLAHYDTTGPEILAQTGGRVTHFVAGLGTTGTFTGVARRLREYNPGIRVVSVQPDAPFHGLEGLKHMDTAIVPGIYDPALADEDLRVGTEQSYAMVRRLAREEGLLVGISSGASRTADPAEAAEPRRVVVPSGVANAIRLHAAEAYPNECCGALFGNDTVITEMLRLPNVTDEGPRRRFLVLPADYRVAEAHASGTGAELAGFYHSHPDHPARPSCYDLDHAWPFFIYLIVSVQNGEPRDMTSWRLRDDRSAFVADALIVEEPWPTRS